MLMVTVANANTEAYAFTELALCVCFKKTLIAVMLFQH